MNGAFGAYLFYFVFNLSTSKNASNDIRVRLSCFDLIARIPVEMPC